MYFYLSYCPYAKNLVFQTFLSRVLWFWLENWYMNLSWHNTGQSWLLCRLTYFYMNYCPLQKFQFYWLSRYWLWVSHMNFSWHCHVWPTFSSFALCKNLVFQTFVPLFYDIDLNFSILLINYSNIGLIRYFLPKQYENPNSANIEKSRPILKKSANIEVTWIMKVEARKQTWRLCFVNKRLDLKQRVILQSVLNVLKDISF